MRGHRHHLRLIGVRVQTGPEEGEEGPPAGSVVRDAEGRWLQSPTNPPEDVLVREFFGFIGAPRLDETPEGTDIDSAAHLPYGTTINPGDELQAYDTGDANLDGRYEIVRVQPGHVMTRVLLKRYTT